MRRASRMLDEDGRTGAVLSGERALGYGRERGYREAGRRSVPRGGSVAVAGTKCTQELGQ
jgi:hypothetical protein